MTELVHQITDSEQLGENITGKIMRRVESICDVTNPQALSTEILGFVMEGIEVAYWNGSQDTAELEEGQKNEEPTQ